ncbi:hypothetical protein BJ085DRAFT_36206 [Dimargaris cristalligena]|uniref:Uncharacterized protein n=1 Tax=Dimargaris cristalligena TaxID=215637 RepID=A0A4P9ZZI7_9FUNG|nr:hypothetical protein BJ085DRAFT_36206 [Dimargaris cristalligena]|eukprot:RKP38362.1 hypothetical protein BJ085DRAFT_36206 [Dimargaris cristalligena]
MALAWLQECFNGIVGDLNTGTSKTAVSGTNAPLAKPLTLPNGENSGTSSDSGKKTDYPSYSAVPSGASYNPPNKYSQQPNGNIPYSQYQPIQNHLYNGPQPVQNHQHINVQPVQNQKFDTVFSQQNHYSGYPPVNQLNQAGGQPPTLNGQPTHQGAPIGNTQNTQYLNSNAHPLYQNQVNGSAWNRPTTTVQ